MNTGKLTYEAIDLLRQLISIPSFSTQEDKTTEAIQKFFEEHNVKTSRKGNNIWVMNEWFDPSKPSIILNSHHDTVKANAGWTLDPFQPVVKDDMLFGLGSNDAGGALVSLIAAFLHFHPRKDLKYNIILAATAEEENSGKGGVELIRDEILSLLPDRGQTGTSFAIVGEPTQMRMAVAEKGLMVLDCVAKGRAGHAARDVGENAIVMAMHDIDWFHSYRFDKVSDMLGPIKMTCTIINAGSQHNVIPDTCRFTVDVRTTDVHSNEVVLETIRTHVRSEVTPRSTRLQPSGIERNNPLVKAASRLRIETFGSATTSDMALWRIPAVKMGPGMSERSHTADEFIFINEIEEGIRTYVLLIEQVNNS